jgi:hypothetical protein
MFGDWICTNHHQPCHCSMDLFKAVWGNHVFSFKTWVVQLFFVPAGWELKAFCWSFHELIYIPEMLNLLCFLLVLSNSKLYSQVWCWWGPKRITRNLKKNYISHDWYAMYSLSKDFFQKMKRYTVADWKFIEFPFLSRSTNLQSLC